MMMLMMIVMTIMNMRRAAKGGWAGAVGGSKLISNRMSEHASVCLLVRLFACLLGRVKWGERQGGVRGGCALRTVPSRCCQLYVQTCCHKPFWCVPPSKGFGELVLEFCAKRKKTPAAYLIVLFERFGTHRFNFNVVAELFPGVYLRRGTRLKKSTLDVLESSKRGALAVALEAKADDFYTDMRDEDVHGGHTPCKQCQHTT